MWYSLGMRYLLLAVLLSGCASTPRGDASNLCNFVVLLTVRAILPATAAICTFGLELVSDEEEGDVRETD
mgnify:CR=1 FL=1